MALREDAVVGRMRPRPDDQALAGSRGLGGPVRAHAQEVADRAVVEDVVPAADVERWRGRRRVSLLRRDASPERVPLRVAEPFVVPGGVAVHGADSAQWAPAVELADGAAGLAQGRDLRGERLTVRFAGEECGDRERFYAPEEAEPELECAALVHPAFVVVRPRDVRHDRTERGRGLARGEPLGRADVRAAEHADLAVRPRLGGRPRDRIGAILALVDERRERPAGPEPAAAVLADDDVTGFHEMAGVDAGDWDVGAVVGRALQEHGQALGRIGPVDVRRELRAVACRDAHVALDDVAARRGHQAHHSTIRRARTRATSSTLSRSTYSSGACWLPPEGP